MFKEGFKIIWLTGDWQTLNALNRNCGNCEKICTEDHSIFPTNEM